MRACKWKIMTSVGSQETLYAVHIEIHTRLHTCTRRLINILILLRGVMHIGFKLFNQSFRIKLIQCVFGCIGTVVAVEIDWKSLVSPVLLDALPWQRQSWLRNVALLVLCRFFELCAVVTKEINLTFINTSF